MACRFRMVPDDTNIDFFHPVAMRFWLGGVDPRRWCVDRALFVTKGLNYGVDFRGGTIMMVATPEAVPVGDFRQLLTGLDFGEVGVTQISDDSGAGRQHDADAARRHRRRPRQPAGGARRRSRRRSTAGFPGIQFLQVDSVGAKVSSELVRSGILAVVLSFVGIGIYVWLRFEWQFALGAVASLVHDAIVTVGIFSILTQLEFDLTIVGGDPDGGRLFDQRHCGGLRPGARGAAQVQEDAAARRAEPRAERDAEPHGDDVDTVLIALAAIYFFGGPAVSGFALRGDLRRGLRHLFLDLRRERRGALFRRQARLGRRRRIEAGTKLGDAGA